jgi:pimeloyl-ACP methyl ester carboxylesterase
MSVVVLVHGAFHGPWCWEPVQAGLSARGIESLAPELPLDGLAADAARVRAVLDEIDDDTVLCGHSWGGAVISAAGAGAPRVRSLVYLCALMLDETLEIPSLGEPGDLADAISVVDGRLVVDTEKAKGAFYHDCEPEVAAASVAQLRSMSADAMAAFGLDGAPAWRAIPSTYAVCLEDRTIDPDAQRVMARRATRAVEWPTSHSPFLSEPQLVVDLLADEAAAARQGSSREAGPVA